MARNDPDIGIDWPLDGEPALSKKDAVALPLARVERERLPRFDAR